MDSWYNKECREQELQEMCKDLDIVAVIKNEKLEWLERILRIGPWRSGQEDV
jgi:histone acetyltransferase (RNA polymerase elongator complex component)